MVLFTHAAFGVGDHNNHVTDATPSYDRMASICSGDQPADVLADKTVTSTCQHAANTITERHSMRLADWLPGREDFKLSSWQTDRLFDRRIVIPSGPDARHDD